MYTQIVSQPHFWEIFDRAEQRVRDVLSHFQGQQWRAIYTAGCGDSFTRAGV
jgi:hypothetical protein